MRNWIAPAVAALVLVGCGITSAEAQTKARAAAAAHRPAARKTLLDQCLDKPEANYSEGMEDCNMAEQKRQEAALQKVYAALEKQYDSQAYSSLLAKSQEAWLAYREAECRSFAGPPETSGTIRPVNYTNCLAVLTEQRVMELKRHRSPNGPD